MKGKHLFLLAVLAVLLAGCGNNFSLVPCFPFCGGGGGGGGGRGGPPLQVSLETNRLEVLRGGEGELWVGVYLPPIPQGGEVQVSLWLEVPPEGDPGLRLSLNAATAVRVAVGGSARVRLPVWVHPEAPPGEHRVHLRASAYGYSEPEPQDVWLLVR